MEMLKACEWLDCLRVKTWNPWEDDEIVLNLQLYNHNGKNYYSVRAGQIKKRPAPCIIFYEGTQKSTAETLFNLIAKCETEAVIDLLTSGKKEFITFSV